MDKILVLTSTFPKYALDYSPNFIKSLSDKLSSDYEIHILAPFSKGSSKKEKVGDLNVYRFKYWFSFCKLLADDAIIPTLKKNKLYWVQVPFFLFFEFFGMFKIIFKEKIRIVHAHWIIPSGLLAVIYKKCFNKKLKIVLTSHGADIYGLNRFNFLKKWVIKNCDYLTVVSSDMKKYVVDSVRVDDSISVIPMGVDTKLFDNYMIGACDNKITESLNILFVGRLSEKKGVIYLLQAIKKIVNDVRFSGINVILNIVGDGEEREVLENYVLNNDLKNYVKFYGGVAHNDLPKFYFDADIFVGPSIKTESGDQEGFGLVFAEALAAACPVISTDIEAISDIVIDNKTGLVVEQKNSKQIVESIFKLVSNYDLYQKLQIGGREHVVKNFDIDIVSKKYLEVFKK